MREGCIEFKKNGYNVVDYQNIPTYTKDENGQDVLTDVIIRRTVVHERRGSGWQDYLENFTDDSSRIRKLKIQVDKLKDNSDRCWGF